MPPLPEIEITPEAFQSLRTHSEQAGTPAPLLLDVREPWEIATASIPGARTIPMNELPSRAHTELDPDEPIVVVCHHGVRSLSVANWLRNQGFDHAQSLIGGIDGWSRTIDHKVPRY